MPITGGNTASRRGGARALPARAFSRVSLTLAAFALFAQLMAPPCLRANARSDLASVAATLRAEFGNRAILCAQADDAGFASSPQRRQTHGDEGCPLCRFAAQLVLFVAPAPSLLARFDVVEAPLKAPADCASEKPSPDGFAQPRAPPFEV